MVYYEQQPQDDEPKPGCLDVIVLTRAIFSLLFWPIFVIVAGMADLAVTAYLFATEPVLALIPVAFTVLALLAYIRWEQNHFRPPDL